MKEQDKDITNSLLSYAIASRDNYVAEKHHVAIASALEGVERGDIKRLIVGLPSGTGVTELVSKCFVEWYLGRNEDNNVILNTYRSDLANAICGDVKANMNTKFYSYTFPSFIAEDSYRGIINKVGRGWCRPTGTGEALLGLRADLVIMDTPSRVEIQKESMAQQYLREWYRLGICLRAEPDGAIVICETPSNHNFSSWVLNEYQHEDWTVITIPTIEETI